MMSLELALNSRGVKSIYHFTTTIGLSHILRQGAIICRRRLDELCEVGDDSSYLGDILEVMDGSRLDGLLGYVNTSISLPNTFLLNAYAHRHEEPYLRWCILEIDSLELLREGVLFSVSNAASRSAKDHGILPGVKGFEALFSSTVVTKHRVFDRIQKSLHHPTDIQAEALIPSLVSAERIRRVLFVNESDLNATVAGFKQLGRSAGNVLFEVNAGAFSIDIAELQQSLG